MVGRVLPSMHQAPGSTPNNLYKPAKWSMPAIPTLGKWKLESQKFKVIFSLIMKLRLAWNTLDTVWGKKTAFKFLYDFLGQYLGWTLLAPHLISPEVPPKATAPLRLD